MLSRKLGHLFRPARDKARLHRAVPDDSVGRPVPRPVRSYPFAWPVILPLFSILFLSGCGGLSVAKKNAVVATPATIPFGNVTVGQTASANIKLQNQGIETVEIENLSVSGPAFSVASTTSFPINLAPGASVIVELQFTPTASGSATEPIMITSSLSEDPTSIAAVTGTGTPGSSKKVLLSWSPPDSPTDNVVGYNVYRSTNGSSYQLLNSGIDQEISYTDSTVLSGGIYGYYVESVDAAGSSSPPSNLATVTVP